MNRQTDREKGPKKETSIQKRETETDTKGLTGKLTDRYS